MKRTIKLAIFNLCFVVASILSISERGLGLSFDLSQGALKFALSAAATFFGLSMFFYVNYLIITKEEKVKLKADSLTSIDECVYTLMKYEMSNSAFSKEISKAIEQLKTLKRRKESLDALLVQNGISESFAYLNQTADKANFYVFSNVKKIINRLIVFDNEEYLSNILSSDNIESHRKYINEILEDNNNILKEYSSLLVAVSSIGDTTKTNLNEIKDMTEALNQVLKG